MREQIEIGIREAIPADAEALLDCLERTAVQTGFMTMGEEGAGLTIEEESRHIAQIFDSPNNCLIVALLDGKIIGMASIHASDKPKINHIGELGIVVDKEYWGFKIGTELLEEVLRWAEDSETINRIELKVQQRNERAIHLYEKYGFELEGVMQRGVRDDGEFLPVCMMSKLI
ncbi:GNAT family N-acetyltransferase [Marinilactibacillus sp. 15R]|uniref:GNAT family N-acetyltransferase n=1 Tax=Marinilactibacillus sp. 15R TaxID=1911586 RepID=UPI00090C9486|nr:GNAT family protein [Marinilactibacillus sp. 15R]API88720.1 GNAT family N-acetyltransferase [Marinilactibacillus sp. 15R]